jgi:hypothetical protein
VLCSLTTSRLLWLWDGPEIDVDGSVALEKIDCGMLDEAAGAD